VAVSVNTTTAALGGQANGLTYINTTFATGPASEYVSSGVVRQSLASTTTVFCPVQSNFATSTMTVNGFIRARRVR
jgi:hypothetical protein